MKNQSLKWLLRVKLFNVLFIIFSFIFLLQIVCSVYYMRCLNILGENLITNFIYFLLLVVAYFAAIMARKQLKLNATLEVYKYIYDEEILRVKAVINEAVKKDPNFFNVFIGCTNKKDFETKRKSLDKKLKNIIKQPGPLKGGIQDVDKLISIYNNLYFLIKKNYLKIDDLPDPFRENAKSYFNILSSYITEKNKYYPGKTYATYFSEGTKNTYVAHKTA